MLVMPPFHYSEGGASALAKARDRLTMNDNFHVDAVIPDLKSSAKVGILAELAEVLSQVSNIPQEFLVSRLLERYSNGGCFAHTGVAIPNCRVGGISACFIVFGRSREGVRFGAALDNKPVHLFFFFCSPLAAPEMHVRSLGHLSNFIKNGFFRNQLLKAESKEKIIALIESMEKGY
jgi:PTS system fructose-specific IIC component